MSENKKSSKFGLGVLVGSVVGALAGLFFSPKSGKQNRRAVVKKIKEIKKVLKEKQVDEKLKAIFTDGKRFLLEELKVLEKKMEEVDYSKYKKAIEKVMARLKKEGRKKKEELDKIRKHLLEIWQEK